MTVSGLLQTAASIILLILACLPARSDTAAPWQNWTTPHQQGHPLTGRIWSASEERFVTPDAVAAKLRDATFLLFGETHDNSDHHRLQAWLVDAAAKWRRPPVVMEMIAKDQALALRAYLAQPDASAAGIGPAIGWDARGWPPWLMYQPIAEVALARHLPILPGDMARSTLRKVARAGLDALGPNRVARLELDKPLGTARTADLLDELYNAHCQVMPRDALAPMSSLQRLRDAVLADSLISGAAGGSAILIAGNGHVRRDRAVPWYLDRRVPQASTVVVMLMEVEANADTPKDMIPVDPDGRPTADYVWFTPRAERTDPCVEFRQRFRKGSPTRSR